MLDNNWPENYVIAISRDEIEENCKRMQAI
jgi:hypothetical protein